ncbi:hypothetical protein CU014_0789 [Enterococcus xinjiangensis]|nr:hypothetical protein [Enterococcus lactis]
MILFAYQAIIRLFYPFLANWTAEQLMFFCQKLASSVNFF